MRCGAPIVPDPFMSPDAGPRSERASLRPLIVMLALAVLGVLGWRWMHGSFGNADGGAGGTAANALPNAGAAASSPSTASGGAVSAIRAIDPATAEAVPGQLQRTDNAARGNADPRTTRRQRLAALQAQPSVALAIRDAAGADDAAINAFSLELLDYCLRNGSPMVKAQASNSSYAPGRMRAPTLKDPPDLFKSPAERTRMLESNRALVAGCAEFDAKRASDDVDSALARLAQRGAALPELMNLIGGTLNLSALTDAQFETIRRALAEQDPTTLALLGQLVQPALINAAIGAAPPSVAEARYFGEVTAPLAWQLALCQLGAWCGHESLWAREACFRFGACAGDDLATAIRAALTRDGLPADVLDKQAARFLDAITGGDPAALGLRRKKPPTP